MVLLPLIIIVPKFIDDIAVTRATATTEAQRKKTLEEKMLFASALSAEKRLIEELTTAERKATDVNTQMMKASTLRREIDRFQNALLRIEERIEP